MQYIQSSDSSTTFATPLLPCPLICIPEHIYKHLYSSGRTITNLLDYAQTYRHLSLEDLVLWMRVNDNFMVAGQKVSTMPLCEAMNVPADKQTEFGFARAKASKESLDRYSNQGCISPTNNYEFRKHNEAIFLLIPKGFIEHVQALKPVRDSFIRQYVEKVYSAVDEQAVTHLPIFHAYIRSFPLVSA